jgi:2-keto-4-pentenoate hydratase
MPVSNSASSQLAETLSSDIVGISERLVQARQEATPLPAFPGTLPNDTKTAYAIQHHSINSWPDEVTGWKVGGVSHSFHAQFGAPRLVGPIFASQTLTALNGESVAVTVFENGFAAVEAEFVIRTAVPFSPNQPIKTLEQLKECIASIHLGAEIASSPMANINELGPGAIISDFGNNAGLIVGPQITNWRDQAMEDIDILVSVNNVLAGRVRTSVADDAFAALEFMIELSSSRGIELPAGTYVTCGALSGIHNVEPGDQASVLFEGKGRLDLTVAKRQPTV